MDNESSDVVSYQQETELSDALDLLFHLPPDFLLKVKVQVQRTLCVFFVLYRAGYLFKAVIFDYLTSLLAVSLYIER